MPTTVTQRKILDRQQWEIVNLFPFATVFGITSGSSTQFDQYQLWIYDTTANGAWLYSPRQDAWLTLPACPLATIGAGAGSMSIAYHPSGPTGTASAGAASTLTTALTLPGSLDGYTIRITGGTGAGQDRVIASNTYGANSVISVTSPWTTNPDNTSVYLIMSGRFYCLNGSTTVGMRYYDIATNTWSAALTVTGVTANGASWRLASTPAFSNTVATGTATSGSATTLVNSGKSWTTNSLSNYQVRITAGTGAGKVATITSNTATTLTFPTVTSVLDSTSVYSIEPNDDFLYASTQAVTLYRYSISGNAWTTLSPGVARSPTPAAGACLYWIGTTTSTAWADESNIKNGRFLYGFNGAATGTISYYDIALNTWTNLAVTAYNRGVAPNSPSTAWQYCVDREFIYAMGALLGTVQPMYKFDAVRNSYEPFSVYPGPYPSANFDSSKLTLSFYTDGGTTIRYLYYIPYTGGISPQPFLRLQIVE